MKLCKDCKWIERKWFLFSWLSYCYNPEVMKASTDGTGEFFANLAREYGPCFKEGKFWERKSYWRFWK